MPDPIVRFRGISKAFAGVQALSQVSLDLHRGECLGLMGENGAGKSTLGRILAGVHRPDSGQVELEGRVARFASPADALAAGIGMVHQELAFCPDLSVAENMCLSAYPTTGRFLVDRAGMRRRAMELLSRIGVAMDVGRPMRQLTTAQEQLVQIATAVATGAKIIVFDEPTSSLSEPEVRRLFDLVDQLRARGLTLVYVSHRMPEVVRLCDRVAVLRDGRHVGTLDREQLTEDRVIRLMVGRSVEAHSPRHSQVQPGGLRLRVRDLSSQGQFSRVSFDLRAGEILGLAGLVGAGRSELAKAIFGLDSAASGSVEIDSADEAGNQLRRLRLGRPVAAMRAGVGLLPEDRKRQGLVLGMSCRNNLSMAILDRLGGFWPLRLLKRPIEAEMARKSFADLQIVAASPEAPASSLSGGNQQKVAIGKWLARSTLTGPGRLRVLIADEPTRGVDVAAKAAIHRLLDDLAASGLAILLISSELPELLALSSRILVMRQGQLVRELARGQADQETLLRHMAGV